MEELTRSHRDVKDEEGNDQYEYPQIDEYIAKYPELTEKFQHLKQMLTTRYPKPCDWFLYESKRSGVCKGLRLHLHDVGVFRNTWMQKCNKEIRATIKANEVREQL